MLRSDIFHRVNAAFFGRGKDEFFTKGACLLKHGSKSVKHLEINDSAASERAPRDGAERRRTASRRRPGDRFARSSPARKNQNARSAAGFTLRPSTLSFAAPFIRPSPIILNAPLPGREGGVSLCVCVCCSKGGRNSSMSLADHSPESAAAVPPSATRGGCALSRRRVGQPVATRRAARCVNRL